MIDHQSTQHLKTMFYCAINDDAQGMLNAYLSIPYSVRCGDDTNYLTASLKELCTRYQRTDCLALIESTSHFIISDLFPQYFIAIRGLGITDAPCLLKELNTPLFYSEVGAFLADKNLLDYELLDFFLKSLSFTEMLPLLLTSKTTDQKPQQQETFVDIDAAIISPHFERLQSDDSLGFANNTTLLYRGLTQISKETASYWSMRGVRFPFELFFRCVGLILDAKEDDIREKGPFNVVDTLIAIAPCFNADIASHLLLFINHIVNCRVRVSFTFFAYLLQRAFEHGNSILTPERAYPEYLNYILYAHLDITKPFDPTGALEAFEIIAKQDDNALSHFLDVIKEMDGFASPSPVVFSDFFEVFKSLIPDEDSHRYKVKLHNFIHNMRDNYSSNDVNLSRLHVFNLIADFIDFKPLDGPTPINAFLSDSGFYHGLWTLLKIPLSDAMHKDIQHTPRSIWLLSQHYSLTTLLDAARQNQNHEAAAILLSSAT